MTTTICFADKKFAECVDFCLALDKKCFPQQMWLDNDEIDSLLEADAWATTLTYNQQEIGLAITIPEIAAGKLLEDIDRQFTPTRHGAYSYSEAIDPQFQRRGIGPLLLKETQLFTSRRGFTNLSAHVRTKFRWNVTRNRHLVVIESRPVEDFWPATLQEPVMFQDASI